MARGNQRDIDRERARKRNQDRVPGKKEGDFNQRRERDAEAMRQKQARNVARQEEEKAPARRR